MKSQNTPLKTNMFPEKKTVGRCIPYWNSSFLGDMLVFRGVNLFFNKYAVVTPRRCWPFENKYSWKSHPRKVDTWQINTDKKTIDLCRVYLSSWWFQPLWKILVKLLTCGERVGSIASPAPSESEWPSETKIKFESSRANQKGVKMQHPKQLKIGNDWPGNG